MEANSEQVDNAKKWVDGLKAGGGTAMQAALDAASTMRTKDEGRSFTVVFFTDGQPTLGEMKPENILKNVAAKNSANTRLFTFGVGDDVNTTFLDQLAEATRAVSTYVRPAEDIETKVSSLYGKITHPVLANVKLAASDNIRLYEIVPAAIARSVLGSQLVVLGNIRATAPRRSSSRARSARKPRSSPTTSKFPSRTIDDKEFVENLWARRKVGFLLDQIRANGEQKELMDEMMTLAKKYGIATPYTSFLVVPDAPMPVASVAEARRATTDATDRCVDATAFRHALIIRLWPQAAAAGRCDDQRAQAVLQVIDFAKRVRPSPKTPASNCAAYEDKKLADERRELEQDEEGRWQGADKADKDQGLTKSKKPAATSRATTRPSNGLTSATSRACRAAIRRPWTLPSVPEPGCQDRLTQTAYAKCLWPKLPGNRRRLDRRRLQRRDEDVVVKAQSDAYFRIIEKNPKMKDVFRLGNYLVYVTPSKVRPDRRHQRRQGKADRRRDRQALRGGKVMRTLSPQ